MFFSENKIALDTYAIGWKRGDADIVYEVLDDTFSLNIPEMDMNIGKEDLKQFLAGFRSTVDQIGGPKINSTHFKNYKNRIQRKVTFTSPYFRLGYFPTNSL